MGKKCTYTLVKCEIQEKQKHCTFSFKTHCLIVWFLNLFYLPCMNVTILKEIVLRACYLYLI